MVELEKLGKNLTSWSQQLLSEMKNTVSAIVGVLEDRAIGLNTVTHAGLKEQLAAAMQPLHEQLQAILAGRFAPAAEPATIPPAYMIASPLLAPKVSAVWRQPTCTTGAASCAVFRRTLTSPR